MCHCCNPPAPVRSPTEPWTHHHRSSWMTLMSGKFIGSWTAGLITITRGQDCFTWLNGKDSITPLMPQVGNHLNTSQMHPTLSRHSIMPTQISRLPELMRRGPCFILFLVSLPTEPFI